MKKIDYLSLEGYSLLTFIRVLDEQSVLKAAGRLRVTQSSVTTRWRSCVWCSVILCSSAQVGACCHRLMVQVDIGINAIAGNW